MELVVQTGELGVGLKSLALQRKTLQLKYSSLFSTAKHRCGASLFPSHHSRYSFFISLMIRFLFCYFSGGSQIWLFYNLVEILMCLWKEVSIVFTYPLILTESSLLLSISYPMHERNRIVLVFLTILHILLSMI